MASHQDNPVLEHQHPPARKAGGMRVKQPNPDRHPLKAEYVLLSFLLSTLIHTSL